MHNWSKALNLRTPFKISLVYLLVGSLWIILSDKFIDILNLSGVITIHSTKGLFYVFLTALVLYLWVKRLKMALTESDERYRILVEHSPEPLVVHSKGKIIYINPAGAEIFGAASPEELIDYPVMKLVHPDYNDFAKERIRMIEEGRVSIAPIEQKFLRLDHQVIDVEVRAVPIIYLGKPAVQLICRDITERKRSQRLLEEREQSYKSLVENNPDAIFVLDLNGQILHMNSATEKITGYQQEELLHQTFSHLMVDGDQSKVLNLFEESAKGESNNTEVAITNKKGYSIDLSLKMVPIIINDKIDGVYGIAKDMTERKRTEELLLKSEKLSVVGQLAAGVAHEIRNPLTSLRGFVQLLQTKMDNYDEYFQIMLAELDRINYIVSEFLVIAKPQAVSFEMKDLRKILQDVISLLDTQAILSDVQIHTTFDSDIPLINCEENQLKQVVINILKNAIEAMIDGGTIEILMKVDDDTIVIRFIDQGCGISEERIAMLGEPFYTTKEKGTGLGLMVSQKIIEAHHGSLHIKSQIGIGTTVDLILPLDPNK
ncbi:PAS domain-containing sensor histidine kinase [Paenibacillus sp. V4I7]|uniref:PAS domain-containing sensor histidine kinase n=1 Tax=Paenibacillus sp. V4I7 TaxID=3042307 RepID=UPI002783456F|nr:PAS domain-containing sensor histidine kinase [Paenibacillus sp. V4I7]MDQ0896624.1 PAS domain S-box-containing protein [Paenibacillus sp. V4I7]